MRSDRAAMFLLPLLAALIFAMSPATRVDDADDDEVVTTDTQPAPPDSQPAETRPASQPVSQPASQPNSQPASTPTTTRAASGPTSTTSSTTSTQAAEKKDKLLAVINGRVVTVTGPTLDGATVLCKNGKIISIGRNVTLPQECEIVDATGKQVYPGLIAATAGGIHGAGAIADTTDVYSLSMNIASAVGITTALAGNSVAKLTYGSVDDMVVKQAAFTSLNYSLRALLERAQLRAELEKVRNYLRELANYEREKATNKDAKAPDKEQIRDRLEEYRKLLTHETTAIVTANSAQELRDICDLAAQYDFKLVIRGAIEGWLTVPNLARANCGVIITPRSNIAPDERFNRVTGSTIENARILMDHGVRVAVIPPTASILTWGVGGRDLTNLNMEAAFAVRGGVKNADGVRLITIDAARLLGVDDRVGSLEVGKDADIIVADGDILHYMTMVHFTIVNGRVAYDKAKDTLYAHIRPDGNKEVVPVFDDIWPRKLEWRD